MGSSDGTNGTGTPGVDPNATPAEPGSYDDERPQRDVSIGEFWMSKYQITNTQYAAFLNAIKANSDGKFSASDYSDGKYPDTELVQHSASHHSAHGNGRLGLRRHHYAGQLWCECGYGGV